MQDSKKDTDVYSGLLDSEGEGEGGMIWENGIETCILNRLNELFSKYFPKLPILAVIIQCAPRTRWFSKPL